MVHVDQAMLNQISREAQHLQRELEKFTSRFEQTGEKIDAHKELDLRWNLGSHLRTIRNHPQEQMLSRLFGVGVHSLTGLSQEEFAKVYGVGGEHQHRVRSLLSAKAPEAKEAAVSVLGMMIDQNNGRAVNLSVAVGYTEAEAMAFVRVSADTAQQPRGPASPQPRF